MKKTHLYGAVAATMLLAPVTANVLAEENDTAPETTNATKVDGLSEGVVLTSEDNNTQNDIDDTETGTDKLTDFGNEAGDLENLGTLDVKATEVIIPKENPAYAPTLESVVAEEEKTADKEQPVEVFVETETQGTPLFQFGTGTEEDPYQISSATELDSIRYDLNAHYVQTAHIDLSGIDWTPIGMETENENTQSFKGVFDGANFAISNLKIREKTEAIYEQFYGLFAKNEGILKNIQLLDVDIKVDAHNITKKVVQTPRSPAGPLYGGLFVGAITGLENGSINDCVVSGEINLQLTDMPNANVWYSGYCGGISGYAAPKNFIEGCKNYSNIQITYDKKQGTDCYAGGIVGYIFKHASETKANIVLKNCSNYGDITISGANQCHSGGIAGYVAGNSDNLFNYGNIYVDNSKIENTYESISVGSIIGFLQISQFVTDSSSSLNNPSFPSTISNIVNFGNIEIVVPEGILDGYYVIDINGLIGYVSLFGTEEVHKIENGYNLGSEISIKLKDANGNTSDIDVDKVPIYRIANTNQKYSEDGQASGNRHLSLLNCYSVDDLKINGKIVDKLIGLDLENGSNLSRIEMETILQKLFPKVEILKPGETVEKPSNKAELEKVFEGNNFGIVANSPSGFRDIDVVLKEVKSDDNFGYSDQYNTFGYHLYLVNKDGNKIERPGDYYGWFAFPEEFNMRVLRGKLINAATNEVVWEEDMGWYRLDEIAFEEENLDLIFVAAELKKEDPKPENPIKTEATFTKDNYEVKAESKEDLTGLEIVIDEVEADNNFGLTSDYQTMGYDIHFENEKGEEVNRTGKFTVRLPIPQQFVGKSVCLFHKENKDAPAKELTFKVIDGKYYEFETTSFSWFIVASQNTSQEPENPNQPSNPSDTNKPIDNNKPSNPEKPSENKPMAPADEANKPVVTPISKDETSTNGETVNLTKRNVFKVDSVSTTRSPETGFAMKKSNSLFAGLMSVVGLGWIANKKRKEKR